MLAGASQRSLVLISRGFYRSKCKSQFRILRVSFLRSPRAANDEISGFKFVLFSLLKLRISRVWRRFDMSFCGFLLKQTIRRVQKLTDPLLEASGGSMKNEVWTGEAKMATRPSEY